MFKLLKSASPRGRGRGHNFSTLKSKSVDSKALILRSTSQNIYENLALEDWLYQNHNFKESKILLFYKNRPCVVIGRHQNPWTEANIPFLRNNSISIGWFIHHSPSKLLQSTFQLDVTVEEVLCSTTWATSTSPSWPGRQTTTGAAISSSCALQWRGWWMWMSVSTRLVHTSLPWTLWSIKYELRNGNPSMFLPY